MYHTFVIEHDLLPEGLRFVVIHASIMRFTNDFIERRTVIGQDSK